MNPTNLAIATKTISVLTPYLAKIADGALEKIGADAMDSGAKLLVWLHEKLSSRGREALTDLIAIPTSDDNQADLRKQLAKTLETDPTLANELSNLLQQSGFIDASTMTVTAGDGAKVAQIKGSGNFVHIGDASPIGVEPVAPWPEPGKSRK